MKVLLVNKFLYPKGGDAISTLATGSLLSSKGHKVIYWGMRHSLNPSYEHESYFIPNIDFNDPGGVSKKARATLNLIYSFEAKDKIGKLINIEKPDIVHLNNFAHQISPSILHVIKKYSIPCVMTMRDYKLVCPAYNMFLNGKPCERCRNGKYYRCFINRCTKESYVKSLLNTAEMYLHHKIMHIYDLIDIYISPSIFLKNKVLEMGFTREVIYLPNYVNVDNYDPSYSWEESSIVYFGRLSQEKGLQTLIEAIREMSDVNLKIIGDGPIKSNLERMIKNNNITNVRLLGYLTGKALMKELKKAMFIVVPSEWYENNPRSIIEGFALGKPVIGARIGGIAELVRDNETGLTFESGNVGDLSVKIRELLDHPDRIRVMGEKARSVINTEFNAENHYLKLMEIYDKAMRISG